MSAIDVIDEQLLQLLRKDGRQSSKTLSRHLHISPATIRRRLSKLVNDDIVRIVPVLDPNKMGLSLAACIFFDVEREKVDSVAQILSERSEIKWLALTTGRFSILVLGYFQSTDEMYDFLQRRLVNIDGIRGHEAFICLRIKKGRYVGV